MMSTQGPITHRAFHVQLVLQRSPEILDAAFEYNTIQSNFQDGEIIDPPAMFALN